MDSGTSLVSINSYEELSFILDYIRITPPRGSFNIHLGNGLNVLVFIDEMHTYVSYIQMNMNSPTWSPTGMMWNVGTQHAGQYVGYNLVQQVLYILKIKNPIKQQSFILHEIIKDSIFADTIISLRMCPHVDNLAQKLGHTLYLLFTRVESIWNWGSDSYVNYSMKHLSQD